MSNSQASQPVISGRELRRARNVVKKWQAARIAKSVFPADGRYRIDGSDPVAWAIQEEICQKRYERACAMILADRLRNS